MPHTYEAPSRIGIQVRGREEAALAAEANTSLRTKKLQSLEDWAEGTQYSGRQSWWDDSNDVPLWERAPCITYPSAKIAIQSNVDLVMGEGRFPVVTGRPEEDESDDEGDGENALSEEDSKRLDRFVREHHKICRFKAHCREAYEAAQKSGTAVAIHGVRNGKPFCDLIPAKWCTPELNVDDEVERLEIRYVFFEETWLQKERVYEVKAYLYRRVIDETRDVTYKPAEARTDGSEPRWEEDPERTLPHDFGFCPVIWYPFMRGCAPFNQIDGNAIHAGHQDKIQGLDVALSESHRCALLSEPQPYATGVSPGSSPTGDKGRKASVPSTQNGGIQAGHPGYNPERDPGPINGEYVEVREQPPSLKKGPGWFWQFSDPNTEVGYLQMDPAVLKNLRDHCDDMLRKLEESFAVVFPRPSEFKTGTVSGRSIEMTKARQYDRCDQHRDDLEQEFIVPSVSMQLRIAQRLADRMRVPGIKAAKPILDRFASDAVDAA